MERRNTKERKVTNKEKREEHRIKKQTMNKERGKKRKKTIVKDAKILE